GAGRLHRQGPPPPVRRTQPRHPAPDHDRTDQVLTEAPPSFVKGDRRTRPRKGPGVWRCGEWPRRSTRSTKRKTMIGAFLRVLSFSAAIPCFLFSKPYDVDKECVGIVGEGGYGGRPADGGGDRGGEPGTGRCQPAGHPPVVGGSVPPTPPDGD